MAFLYLKIPTTPQQTPFWHPVHEALESALAARGLGELVSWGSSLGPHAEGRAAAVAWHRIDVQVVALQEALPVLRETLLSLSAPAGTEIHYALGGQAMLEDLQAGGWTPARGAPPAPARHQDNQA